MVRSFYIFAVFYLISTNVANSFAEKNIDSTKNSDILVKLAQEFENFQKQLNSIEAQLKTIQTTINLKSSIDDDRCSLRDIMEAIKGHKFKLAEEKLNQLVDKNKISNIVHDVYADSSANFDVILSFAKALIDGDLKYRVFSALCDEMHSSGQSDPFRLITLVEAMEREMTRLKNATPELKAQAKTAIENAVEDVKVTSTSILKTAMIIDKYENNMEIENLAAEIFRFRTDVSNEIMERVVDSVFGVVAAGRIIDNISSHQHIPQVITGLTAVYNRFNFAGNLNNDATLDLASHLKKLQLREKYSLISQTLKNDVERVVQQLPTCAKNLFFHKHVCFWNKARGEYMYAAASSISYDAERRSIYTWYPGDVQPGAYWYAQKMGNDFYFKSRDYADEYMYAVAFDYNKDMRYIFNWIAGNNTDSQSAWKIELDGDYCYVKSSHFNEYMFAPAVRYDQLNSYVFTWKPGTSVRSAEFQWQIRNCAKPEMRGMSMG